MDVEPKIGLVNLPKWMVYNGKPLLKWDDLGGFPIIFGNTHMFTATCFPLGFFMQSGRVH